MAAGAPADVGALAGGAPADVGALAAGAPAVVGALAAGAPADVVVSAAGAPADETSAAGLSDVGAFDFAFPFADMEGRLCRDLLGVFSFGGLDLEIRLFLFLDFLTTSDELEKK